MIRAFGAHCHKETYAVQQTHAGRKAELGERRGEAEALRFCRKSFLGAVRCSRRFHLRSKSRSRSSGY
jgi:hypothetical protein